MKTKTKGEAKGFAKAQSLHKDHEDIPVYIIRCNRTEFFYVDTNSFIRMLEQIIGAMSMEFLQWKYNIHKKHKTQKS